MSDQPDQEELPVLVRQALHNIRMARVLGYLESAHRWLALNACPHDCGLVGLVPLNSALAQIGLANSEGKQYLAGKLSELVQRTIDPEKIHEYGVKQEIIDPLIFAKKQAFDDSPKQRANDLKQAYRDLSLTPPSSGRGCLLGWLMA